MQVTLKLYASLGRFLPPGAVRNAIKLDIGEQTTIQGLLDHHNLPREDCHLVMVNGVYHAPDAREQVALVEGDELAVWPRVAGG